MLPDFVDQMGMGDGIADMNPGDMAMDVDLSLAPNNPANTFSTVQASQQLPPSSQNTPVQPFSAVAQSSDSYANIAPDLSSNSAQNLTDANAQIDPNAIGGGPLPAAFNMIPQQDGPGGSGSTLTDFTKRRNWSQRVLEELRDFLYILTPEGRILYSSPSTRELTGWEPVDIVGKFIHDYIHPDDSGIFIVEFNEAIATGNPLRFFYRLRQKNGSYLIFEAHGHAHLSSEVAAFGPGIDGRAFCRGFFMMSRPYPTKNAQMLDSFLEHKIENERLTKRIAELKREEAEENALAERQWQNWKEGDGTGTASETHRTDMRSGTDSEIVSGSGAIGASAGDAVQAEKDKAYREMPPPAKPSISNIALTRQNLDEALAASKPDSINDKMARYEGLSNYDSIEMLTGLRYRDGERSQGISTGDTSPHLIRGDVGIAILADRDKKESKANKKLKVADEYVCTDCGTLDSPEWRKGPNGPKTLCNACGCKSACQRLASNMLTYLSTMGKERKKESQSRLRDSFCSWNAWTSNSRLDDAYKHWQFLDFIAFRHVLM